MNWNPFSKKDSSPELDPLQDLTLSALKPGYVLEYDLKTWQVSAHSYYDYDGDRVEEWELTCADEVRYLTREEDDGVSWSLTRKVPLNAIDEDIRRHMRDSEDPPDPVTFDSVEYIGKSSEVGKYFKDGEGSGEEFVEWEYLDESERKTLTIEQWGDDEFEASAGEIVEEYQFTDILPAAE